MNIGYNIGYKNKRILGKVIRLYFGLGLSADSIGPKELVNHSENTFVFVTTQEKGSK